MDTQSHSPVSQPSFAEPLLSTGSLSVRPFSLLGYPSSGSASHTREIAQWDKQGVRAQDESYRRAKTIDILSDYVLLEIFDSYRKEEPLMEWKWLLLVHVCRRWRQITFGSQNRLNLRILCTRKTPVRKELSIWPAFPIVLSYRENIPPGIEDDVIAALEHPDRVCDVYLGVWGLQWGKIATTMQVPFPVLTTLSLTAWGVNAPLPGRFLGGYAPSLRKIDLYDVPYPTLPTLLLSASDLVQLNIREIPPTGYISPEAMVVALAALPRLANFEIGFHSATSRPDRIAPPPETRTVLPALTQFRFWGASEYLEGLVARIDSPQLEQINIYYFNQLADFRAADLSQFIDRSVGPETTLLFRHAIVHFSSKEVMFVMYPHRTYPSSHWRRAETTIRCEGIDWQVSHTAQLLSQFSVTLSGVVHLDLKHYLEIGRQFENTDDVEWLLLLHQFTTVQTLRVSRKLAGHIALALEDIAGGTVAEVLPSLDLIWLGGRRASSVKKFIDARRLAGRPVTVISALNEFDKRLESYVKN